MHAVLRGHLKIAEYLLESGADLSIQDKVTIQFVGLHLLYLIVLHQDGETALERAKRFGSSEVVEFLQKAQVRFKNVF